MNVRCYRCGWSFSLGREAVMAAVAASAGQKLHVEHCPRCRQAIKLPMIQLKRELPAGWQPAPSEAEAAPVPTGEAPGAQTLLAPPPEATPTLAEEGHASLPELASSAAEAAQSTSRQTAGQVPAARKRSRRSSKE